MNNLMTQKPTHPFIIYEVQEEVNWRIFRYEIQGAVTYAQAIDRLTDRDPVDLGSCGDNELTERSGFGETIDEAREALCNLLP